MPSLFSNLAAQTEHAEHAEHHLEKNTYNTPFTLQSYNNTNKIYNIQTKLKQNQRNKTHLHMYIHN